MIIFLQYIFNFLLLVIAFIGMVRYKKLTIPFKILAFSMAVSFILSIGSKIVSIKYKNNAPVSHLETWTNYVFYALVYLFLFKNKHFKTFIRISIFLITAFTIFNGLFLQPFERIFPTNVEIVTGILFVIFSLILFKQMLQYPLQVNIIKQSVFWFNTAILFCYATMFLNLALTNYYSQHHLITIVYYFWLYVNMIFNLLLLVSILMDKKETLTSNATL